MITPSYNITSTERVLPRMTLDFTTASLDSRVTLTRALNTATVINSSGQIAPINANLPRFDYTLGTGGACKGLLIEETRTNLFLNSVLSGVVAGSPGTAPTSWVIQFGTGATTGLVTSIYGTLDGAQAIRFSGTSIRMMYAQTLNVTAGQQYAFSAYLEAVSGNIADFMTVTNGTATVTMNTTATSPQTAGRYTVLFTASTTGTCTARIGVGTTGATSGAVSATFSRPQVEAGSFATSYIPTTTTALTRNADVATMTGTNFSSWYNATEGAFYGEALIAQIASGGASILFEAGDGTTSNRIVVFRNTNVATTSEYVFTSGSNQAALDVNNVFAANAIGKFAAAYKVNDFQAAGNTVLSSADTLGTVPTVSRLYIGNSTGSGNFWNGVVRKIAYYPMRLTNAQLQALTAS